MATSLLVPKNRAASTLAAALTAGATSFDVAAGEGANFPSTYPFHLTIDDEIVSCTNRSTDTLTIARAQQGTSAVAHSINALVALNHTAKAMTDLNTIVNRLEDDVPTFVATGDMRYASAAGVGVVLTVGATDTILSVQAGVPTWRTPANIMSDLSGQAGADFSMNSNKITSVTDPTNAQDAATKAYADLHILASLFDAHTILYAVSDNTPLALTVAASRIVGRKTSGNISAMTGAETLALLTGANLDVGAYDVRGATLTADGLTSGRVVFAGASGVLSDDADFTFSTDTLTVTKIAGTEFTGAVTGISLSEIENLEGDKTFTFAAKTMTWNFTTPSEGFVINVTGAFNDHIFHIHQLTGNPGVATELIHLETEDSDVLPMHIEHSGNNASFEAIEVELHRSSPTDGDNIVFGWHFWHDGALTSTEQIELARIKVTATDVSEDNEDASLTISVMKAGSMTDLVTITSTVITLAGTLAGVTALDATTESTIEAAIDTLANLTSIQGQTVTLAGAFITSGAYSLTLTQTAATNVTLPTTGTLATLAGTEELTNKTLNASVFKGTFTASGTVTFPAFTLGGDVAGGGKVISALDRQLYNETNLLENGDFEVGDPPTGWILSGSTLAQEGTIVKIGSKSLKIHTPTSNNRYARQDITTTRYQGRKATLGAWVYAPSANVEDQRMQVRDNVEVTEGNIILKDDAWHWVTVTHTSNAGAATLGVRFYISSGTGYNSGDILYVDGAILVEGDSCPAFSPKPVSVYGGILVSPNVVDLLKINGTQVVSAQGAAVADASDAASVILRLNDLLARLRTHGMIAT